MADYLVKEESLISIADAIREKTGETAELSFPEDYIIKINDLANASDEVPSNGKEWIQSNISNSAFDDIHGNGEIWVACSPDGLYYSEDGKTWSQTNKINEVFYHVNYANGTWVASSEGNLYYSTDGINWSPSDYYGGTRIDQNIEYHNGCWGYLDYDMNEFYYSPDGIYWETVDTGVYPMNVYYNKKLEKWVAFEELTLFNAKAYTSSTGTIWSDVGIIRDPNLIFYNNFCSTNEMTVTSYDGSLLYSTDGINFIDCETTISSINKIFYSNGIWLTLSGSDGIYYSTNGIDWSQSSVNSGNFTSVYYENFMWIAGSDEGIYYSADGINWTQTEAYFTAMDVYCDGSIWVAGTDSDGLYYSNSWTSAMREAYESVPDGDEVSY